MAALNPPICDFGWPAPDFRLKATDGKTYSLSDLKGEKGTLIMFICNHCPFVKAIADKIARDADELKSHGINTVAIMSNDAANYPEDSFEKMGPFAAQNGFNFPYLYDENQEIARNYGAVCTPDFFGFNADLELQYRGRLDASGMNNVPDSPRDLFTAMMQIAKAGSGPKDQIASIGCSIKWKAA